MRSSAASTRMVIATRRIRSRSASHRAGLNSRRLDTAGRRPAARPSQSIARLPNTNVLGAAEPSVPVGRVDREHAILSSGIGRRLRGDGRRRRWVQSVPSDGEGRSERNRRDTPNARPTKCDPATWSVTVRGSVASLTIAGHESEIPTSAIRKVRFSDPDSSQSPSWPADVGKDSTATCSCATEDGGVDFLEGKVSEITNESVVFQWQGESVPAKRSKIDGMIIFHKAMTRPPPQCVVDAAGNRFNARSVSLADSSLQVGGYGVSFTVPWVDVAQLDYSVGKVVYLSDLEPQSTNGRPISILASRHCVAQFTPRGTIWGRSSTSAFGRPNIFQRIGGLASRTEITYRLPAGVKKFKATAGIDDSVRDVGRVRLEVSLDGKKTYDQPITGKAP